MPSRRIYASGCRTSSSSAFSLTSLPTAKPPLGMGAFQSRPNAVRSTTVSNSSPRRSLPSKGCVAGPLLVPVIVTGFVTPLIVSSPSMSSVSPSARMAVDRKESCGCRSASKKSGDEQVAVQVGLGHVDGRDVDRAPQAGVVERDVERPEAAAEVRDDHVLDGEADGRVHGVDLPRPGREGLCAAPGECSLRILSTVGTI